MDADLNGELPALEPQVALAKAGDAAALESLVRAIQPEIHTLALRFLWHPQDAQDATQEILIRVVTGLQGFQGASRFRTWVYRVACNALLTLKDKKRMELRAMSFEDFARDLEEGLQDEPAHSGEVAGASPDHALLLEEVKIGCTLGMLLCLDREHRLAYVLGEVMELEDQEACEVLEITPAAFRKRLSRARADITALMQARCGLFDAANACRCSRRTATAIALGRVDPGHLLFASSAEQARRFPQVLHTIRDLETTRRAAALYRSQPAPQPPAVFARWLREVLAANGATKAAPAA
jgi:RNA polymerase sigma factor (sigma-70 family)